MVKYSTYLSALLACLTVLLARNTMMEKTELERLHALAKQQHEEPKPRLAFQPDPFRLVKIILKVRNTRTLDNEDLVYLKLCIAHMEGIL